MWLEVLQLLPLLGGLSQGQKDRPDLKDENGDWLPLHYMQHARAEADDLESVYKDGHTICDNSTGVPVGRWSPSLKAVQPIKGFTIQGLPVYEEVPSIHPVWTTRRDVPPHLGSPGSEGAKIAENGSNHYTEKPINYRRGEVLAAFLGSYGPLSAPRSVPPSTGSAGASMGLGLPVGLLLAGAAMLAASGNWLPALLVGGLSLFSGLGGAVGSGGGGVASGPSGERGGSSRGRG